MSGSNTYILIELAGAFYGVRSEDVQHIEMLEHVTPVPNTAPAVDGVVFSRGQLIPVINLRVRFGLARQAATPRSRLVFLKIHERIVGLLVDAAREFRTISLETIRPIQETLHGIEGNYVKGVATVKDRLILLLDISAVLKLEEIALPSGANAAVISANR